MLNVWWRWAWCRISANPTRGFRKKFWKWKLLQWGSAGMVKITWISPSLRCKTQHCEIPKMEYFRNGGELHIGPSLEIPEWILLLNMTKFPEIRSNLSSFNQFVDQPNPSQFYHQHQLWCPKEPLFYVAGFLLFRFTSEGTNCDSVTAMPRVLGEMILNQAINLYEASWARASQSQTRYHLPTWEDFSLF